MDTVNPERINNGCMIYRSSKPQHGKITCLTDCELDEEIAHIYNEYPGLRELDIRSVGELADDYASANGLLREAADRLYDLLYLRGE